MVVIYLLVATLIGVILAPFVLVTVPSGYVGVLWKRFGGSTPTIIILELEDWAS
jgi:hypothetical protein